MLTGRVVQFDEGRGYGFIAPDNGGEDVFVHVNILGNDRWSFAPGVPVEYQAVEGERGPKALSVRVLGDAPAVRPGSGAPGDPAGQLDPAAAAARPAIAEPGRTVPVAPGQEIEDGMFDVLSERALHFELTELLLHSAPDLTAGQVVAIRRELLGLARRHGWTEED